MSLLWLYAVILKATVLSFSGFASVPLVRHELVLNAALLTDAQLNGSIAISQISPGPLGMYLVAVGYFVAGVPGAVCGLLAVSTPAVVVLLVARLIRFGKAERVRRFSAGIVIASSMLVATTGLSLAPFVAATPTLLVIALITFVGIVSNRIPPVVAVLGGIAVSVLLRAL